MRLIVSLLKITVRAEGEHAYHDACHKNKAYDNDDIFSFPNLTDVPTSLKSIISSI